MFGLPRDLSNIVLPTYESVMKQYLMFKHQLKSTEDAKDPSVGEISELVAPKIERIWELQLVLRLFYKYIGLSTISFVLSSYHDNYAVS